MADSLLNKIIAALLSSDDSQELLALKRSLAEAIRRADAVPPVDLNRQRDVLIRGYAALEVRHAFQRGQIVRWKAGLRNKNLPAPRLGIVLEIAPQPFFEATTDSNSPMLKEPLDIRIGVISPTEDIVGYWFDSRRFEPA